MSPQIGLQIQNAKLKQELEKRLGHLELDSIAITKNSKLSDQPHLYISDELTTDPDTPLILIQDTPDYIKLRQVINGGKDVVWLKALPDNDILIEVIKCALEDSVWSQQSILLSREINIKNKQLEQMNLELENIVAQRTHSIAEAKKEAEAKQKKIRRLVVFVQNLSQCETLSDYLENVRQEFRAQFAVTDVFHASESMRGLLSKPKELRLFLANKLSRPVGRVLQLQIYPRLPGSPQSFLLIEHGMDEEKLEEFISFVSERLQILGLALERIFLFDELTKSSIEWEGTFDTLNDPVGIMNVDYKLLRSNSSFGNSQFRSKCHRIFAGSDSICPGCPVQEAAKSGSLKVGEVRRNGRTYRVHSYPVRINEASMVTTVVNHYVDITEDRQLYSRVIQHEKMTALGIMAGHIAHELNNPLTGIRSLCQVLGADPTVADGIKTDLKEIETASQRCQMIIKDLLEFTLQRDENGVQKTSLNDVVNKTLPMLKTAMRFHSSNLDLEEGESKIMANPHLLQQVVFNLVNNSCQAMEQPGTVTITTKAAGGVVTLSISDTGKGISEEHRARLFEPFFTTKPQGEGTGLGLSMSRAIVEKFGGKIDLARTGDEGSCFEISFPEVES